MRRRHGPPGRAAVGAAVVVLGAGVLGACGGDSGASPDPSPDASAGASSGATAGPSSTPSSTPSAGGTESGDPASTLPPATGPRLKMPSISLRLPEGWRLRDPIIAWVQPAGTPDGTGDLSVADSVSLNPAMTLEQQAKVGARTQGFTDVTFYDSVTVGGVEMYHIGGAEGPGRRTDLFGTIHQGNDVHLHFTFDRSPLSLAEQRSLMQSVLNSVRWHDNSPS